MPLCVVRAVSDEAVRLSSRWCCRVEFARRRLRTLLLAAATRVLDEGDATADTGDNALSGAADGDGPVARTREAPTQTDPRQADAARRKRELDLAATRIDELLVDQQEALRPTGGARAGADVDE